MRCKKRVLLNMILAGVLVMLFFAAASADSKAVAYADSKDAGETGTTLTVGVPENRCPVFYNDRETGEVTGIGVDLMRKAALSAGYVPKFVVVKEENLAAAIDNSAYDVVMPFGSAVKSVTGHATVVSDNLIQTPFTLVTEGESNLPELKHLRIGMLKSLSAGAQTVKQLYPGVKVSLYDTMDECVNALHAGDVDALLHNSYVWSYVLQKPAYEKLTVQPNAMFSMDFRVGALDDKAGRKTIARLNGGIAKLTDTLRQAVVLDHTYRKLYAYELSDYLYEYWVIILLAVMLVIALTVIIVQKWRAASREQEEKLRYMVDHDPLTGVLSHNGFVDRVEKLLRDNPDSHYVISYNNIKNFKYINDSLGRASGDDLLRFWVERTLQILSDDEAIGRLEADHFAVLRCIRGENQMEHDEQVIDEVRNYFTNRGKQNRVQICGGMYVVTHDDLREINVDRMLDFARVAEKRLRETRNDGYEFYNPEQWAKGRLIADICSHLPVALKADELKVWYQPQVDYETGNITGAEALCRWDHANLGWVSPADFIPALEESGLVYDLDCYVWERVCKDLQRWNDQGVRRCVSVNLSRCDISEERDVPGQFSKLITKYGLGADQLHIEITESAYVENPDLLIRITKELHELGFAVEMDDFGSGYSSLNMLKEVSVDRIKLDLHFLTETGDPVKGRTIISHVIKMVQALGMGIIAEGVENSDQAEYLHGLGCSEMQGFYYYKPMPADEYEKL